MDALFNSIHEFTFLSVLLRLLLAMTGGCIIGFGRARKSRAAGLRTYMLISIGAALAMLLALYENEMLNGAWAPIVESVGKKFDGSRYGAQVINGIGFLGAGTILAAPHLKVSGLSTATALFAAVCMGISAGAGFFECVIVVIIFLVFVLELLLPFESAFKRRLRNITLFVEFRRMSDLVTIRDLISSADAQLFDLDIESTGIMPDEYPSAVIAMKLSKRNPSHSEMISSIAGLNCVRKVQEIIS